MQKKLVKIRLKQKKKLTQQPFMVFNIRNKNLNLLNFVETSRNCKKFYFLKKCYQISVKLLNLKFSQKENTEACLGC